jgi:hypothetical protein
VPLIGVLRLVAMLLAQDDNAVLSAEC